MIFSRIEEYAHKKGYYVDSNGILCSPHRQNIRTCISPTGYVNFTIRIHGENKQLRVHRLMAYQKFGDRIYDPLMVVRHLDGNRLNNSSANIAIGTQSENRMDVPVDIRRRTAIYATSFVTKYNRDMVNAIKEYKKTHGYKDTMQEFCIRSKGTLWNILNKR